MSDGVWMSVSEVAAVKGVSKQAVSKRLQGLAGKVTTRRNGRELQMNLAEYDRAVGSETDPSQALRNAFQTVKTTAENPATSDTQNIYSDERARREGYAAELARLDLEERIGKLLKVADVEQAMVRCAEILVRSIDQLPARTDNPDLRPILKDFARDLRDTVARELKLAAAGPPATDDSETDNG
jgi:hypothetical protein